MVDRGNRDLGAAKLRDFLDGKITNDEFLNTFPRSKDHALQAALRLAWNCQSDFRVHALTGKDKPQMECKILLERCWLFLKTNLEYDWNSIHPPTARGFLELIGLGWLRRVMTRKYPMGETEIWPFFKRTDYEATVHNT